MYLKSLANYARGGGGINFRSLSAGGEHHGRQLRLDGGLSGARIRPGLIWPSVRPSCLVQTALFTARVKRKIKFKLPIFPPADICPIPQLNRKWKRKLPKLLEEWEGEFPPPLQSTDPEIFAAQQRIFGYYPQSLEDDGKTPRKTDRKRFERWVARSAAVDTYHVASMEQLYQSIKKDLKFQKKALIKEGLESEKYRLGSENPDEDYETALSDIDKLLRITRLTPQQVNRRRKVQILRRRGKGPPKKGEGKRSGKGKK